MSVGHRNVSAPSMTVTMRNLIVLPKTSYDVTVPVVAVIYRAMMCLPGNDALSTCDCAFVLPPQLWQGVPVPAGDMGGTTGRTVE